jgi:hypothetical protein
VHLRFTSSRQNAPRSYRMIVGNHRTARRAEQTTLPSFPCFRCCCPATVYLLLCLALLLKLCLPGLPPFRSLVAEGPLNLKALPRASDPPASSLPFFEYCTHDTA